jgi:archaellum component FlaC
MFPGPWIIPVFGILLILVPVTGLTVGLLAKSLAKTRRETESPREVDGLAAQVAALQDEVESLSQEVKELKAAQDFDRKLLGREKS